MTETRNTIPQTEDAGAVERTAFLFEEGDYPDKGLSVDSKILDSIVQAFDQPAPIQIEHTEGPVKFGWLVRIWREGARLMGKLRFSKAAWDLVIQSGAKRLSIGLDRETLRIREVSLVRRPRIADAQVFAGQGGCTFNVEIETGGEKPPQMDPEIIRLRAEINRRDAIERLNKFKADGKIAPAAEDAALALLSADTGPVVSFASETVNVADAFAAFLDAQGRVIVFGEMADANSARQSFSSSDRQVFEALGITETDAAKWLGEENGGR